MNIDIVSIHGQGDADAEFVYLKVTQDCNLQFYMLTDSTYVDESHISNKLRHLYWFPDQQVKAGDRIILSTNIGTKSTSLEDGVTTHYLYWNLKQPVWNNTGDTAVLLNLNGWKSKAAFNSLARLAA